MKKEKTKGVATQIIVRHEVGEWQDVEDEGNKDS